MEIEFKGGNCVIINHKKESFVVDPKISTLGLKDQGQYATAQLLTQPQFAAPKAEGALIIDGPGEYEVHNCTIRGIAAQSHIQPEGAHSATIYCMQVDDIHVAVLGHIAPRLSETQVEAIGIVDVLIVPVGDHGYTLDAKEAAALVREIDPKVVIPTHYAEEGVEYEVPQAKIDEFLTELGVVGEESAKLKLKAGQLPERLTVYKLTRSK